jgi:DNA-directed RNA polymerase subunit E"
MNLRKKPKACKKCKRILTPDATKCFYCGSEELTKLWKGEVIIIDPENSYIAKKLNIKEPGVYAVKMR